MEDLATTKTETSISIEFDEDLYPRDAIYGAAYIFIDRCYVFLARPAPGRISVKLQAKPGAEQDPDALGGEFANELLGQAWRRLITDENRVLIEQVSTLALAGSAGAPGLDELMDADIGGDTAFEDPLGIAMSWEDKYKKKGRDAGAEPEKAAEK
jgi:His-Xaa-Ser system protein HxsD